MGIIVTFLFLIIFLLTLYQSFWGVVGIFGFIFAEKLAGDYIPFGDSFTLLLTLATGGSYLFWDVGVRGEKMKLSSKKIQVLLLYIVYLAISSIDTFFTDSTRNWSLTYIQSFLMVVLIANTVKSFSDVRKTMIGIVIFGFFCTLTFLLENWRYVFQSEIDGGANTYGRLFLIIIIFAYSFIKDWKFLRINNLIQLSVIFITFLGLLTTGSRTSFILLVFLVGYYLLKVDRIHLSQILLGLSFVFVAYFLIPISVIENILVSFDDSHYEGNSRLSSISQNARFFLWQAGFEMLNDHNWIFGIGVGNYKHLILDYLPIIRSQISHPHNTYLSVLIESGILGLLIFSWLVYLTYTTFRAYRLIIHEQHKRIVESWFLAFVIFLIGGLTKHDHYDKLLFLFIGISIVFENIKYERQKATVSD